MSFLINSYRFGVTEYPTGAAVAFGLRELPGYSWTGALIKVRRSSDNTENDFYQGATAGSFNTTRGGGGTSLESFCSGTNGFIRTWYDQSGNGNNLTQTTAASQPQIVSSGSVVTVNEKPAIDFVGASSHLLNLSSTVSASNPVSTTHIFKRKASGDIAYGLENNDITTNFIYTPVLFSDNKFYFRTRNHFLAASGTDTSSAQMILTGVMSSSNRYMRKNGSAISTTETSISHSIDFVKFGNGSGGPNNAYSQEYLLWSSDQNSNISTIETAGNQYYGVF